MCLLQYLICILCMQCKLRGLEGVLRFRYSFVHLLGGAQCPSVTSPAPL